jgi:hypothetical protein
MQKYKEYFRLLIADQILWPDVAYPNLQSEISDLEA